MSFQGWPEAALDFFEGLERENTKAYWTAHRPVYDEAVLPHRDIRFSADKSPYKTEIGAMLGSAYVRLSAAGLAAGNGMFHLAPDQLTRYRQGVAEDVGGAELARITAALAGQDITLIGHEVLKSAPRGYPADHPRIELLRHKGLAAFREWPVEAWLGTPAAGDRIREFLAASRPLTAWLDEHVGPPAPG